MRARLKAAGCDQADAKAAGAVLDVLERAMTTMEDRTVATQALGGIKGVFAEMKGDLVEMKGDLAEIKGVLDRQERAMDALREEMRLGFEALQTSMKTGFTSFRWALGIVVGLLDGVFYILLRQGLALS